MSSEMASLPLAFSPIALHLHASLDSLPFLFWIKDTQGRYSAVNQEFTMLCQRASTQEVLGLTDLALWPPEMAQTYRLIDSEVMRSGRAQTREECFEEQGQARWLETVIKPLVLDNGEVSGTVGFSRDVTERKSIEAQLQAKTEHLDAIFALSPDGFVSFDASRRVLYVSPAFTRMTGLDSQELGGLDEAEFGLLLAQRCSPADRFPGLEAMRGRDQNNAQGDRQLIVLSLGSRPVLEVVLREGQNPVVSQILYFRDVSHEHEIDRLKAEFLSTAAHELRTPMVSIYGFAEVMQSQELDQASRQEFLGIMLKQSERMITILNELLDLAHIDERGGKGFVFQKTHVQATVAEEVNSLTLPEGRGVPAMSAPSQPLYIMADQLKAQRAIQNVLVNAYKYSSQGQVSVLVQRRESAVAISVTDQGIGMTPEQLDRVGERFYRADASGKVLGTGLGMSLVKEIMVLHHGSVEIVSELGRGTTVTLVFPLSSPTAASAADKSKVIAVQADQVRAGSQKAP
jgi:PAS domain S-box-containing protein